MKVRKERKSEEIKEGRRGELSKLKEVRRGKERLTR
jgi:hypothetical protein